MDKDQNNFSYTYSAREQEEIKKIRGKYVTREESSIERLRRLDEGVTKKATSVSIIIGVIGSIIMGGGMSMCMVGPEELFLVGVGIGVVGIAVVALAYPIYSLIVKKEREKIAPEIIRITDELMK